MSCPLILSDFAVIRHQWSIHHKYTKNELVSAKFPKCDEVNFFRLTYCFEQGKPKLALQAILSENNMKILETCVITLSLEGMTYAGPWRDNCIEVTLAYPLSQHVVIEVAIANTRPIYHIDYSSGSITEEASSEHKHIPHVSEEINVRVGLDLTPFWRNDSRECMRHVQSFSDVDCRTNFNIN